MRIIGTPVEGEASPSCAAELLQPGARLADRYLLIRPIVDRPEVPVWAVADQVAGLDLELTVLAVDDERTQALFAARARALEAVRDPALARVTARGRGTLRACGRTAMVAYLVTEPVPGLPLTRLPPAADDITLARVLDLLAQAAEGVDMLHRSGIVHGGIRRSTLFADRRGRVMVSDVALGFGAAATAIESNGPDGNGLDGNGLDGNRLDGAAVYLAPELWRPGAAPTPLSDLYALGVVTYECLAGRLPHAPEEAASLATVPWGAQPPELPPDLSGELATAVRWVVATALQPDPRRRFSSAGQFADALADLTQAARNRTRPSVIIRRPALPPTPMQGMALEGRAIEGMASDPGAAPEVIGARRAVSRVGRLFPGSGAARHGGEPFGRRLGRQFGRLIGPLGARARSGDVSVAALDAAAVGLILMFAVVVLNGMGGPGGPANMVLHLYRGRAEQQAAADPALTTAPAGPAMAVLIRVPDLTGRPLATALTALRTGLHLQVRVQWQTRAFLTVGTVIGQTPAGVDVPQGTVVTLSAVAPPAPQLAGTARPAVPAVPAAPPSPRQPGHPRTTPSGGSGPSPTQPAGGTQPPATTPSPTSTPTSTSTQAAQPTGSPGSTPTLADGAQAAP